MRTRIATACLAVGALACARAPIDGGEEATTADETTDDDADSGGTGSSSTSDGGTTDVDPTDDASSTGPAVPQCGNGMIDEGEQCDDESGACVDCRFVCGFSAPIALGLTSDSVVTDDAAPVSIPDGSGDYAVISTNGLHRVDASGQEQWINTYSITTDWTDSVIIAGDDTLWVAWRIGAEDPGSARLTRHSPDDGSEIGAIDVSGMPGSSVGGFLGTPDGFYSAMSIDVDALTTDTVVERRSDQDGAVEWSTVLTTEPGADGYAQLFAAGIALADDGTMFVGGRLRATETFSHPHITKLAADGSVLWQRSLWVDPEPSRGAPRIPRALSDGGVVVSVWRQYNTQATAIGAYPDLTTRVIRLDAEGEIVWDIDPTDQVDDGRVQVLAVRALPDTSVVVAGALVGASGAVPWLGHLDAEGTLACAASGAHPSGLDAAFNAMFVDADGNLMLQGFADDDEFIGGLIVESRFIAPVGP